jgi:Flp pilus assembly pilin Flp
VERLGAGRTYQRVAREGGQALVEYSLILVLVATVVVLTLTAIGGWADTALAEVVDDL